LQILEEEITVNTSDPDQLSVTDGEDILEGLDCGNGRCYASCLRNEGGLVVAVVVSTCNDTVPWGPAY
jgi:hypothetical protein